ncbi:hypothetical protein IGB42_04166 [Andreprevotia sp. IGB-42]|uniref:hypothetical protein n=1 Tax=Andreprevotia sp. IGB-42 TaxID=2497473 RepID=UPI00135BD90C|nr:hypothetical protein [Andreprevotia sp. IGB-42]KAF0811400.1 hypothetical protein IGB42_04166 [Andreprevotia sp. IGB-42]
MDDAASKSERIDLLVIGDLPIDQVLPVLGAFSWNFAVCVGPDSEQMHDAVDDWCWDNGEKGPPTTWHDDEIADEIMDLISTLGNQAASIHLLMGQPASMLESELIQAFHAMFGPERVNLLMHGTAGWRR